ncbi:MAG TPA: GNAT family N-acetyltransferase [Gemmatimonadales bacterium]|jgi:RimJ/RimL family protein N-acetyltransferase|nr:GNAT family N-acetyltransferase [Gemmatimonadales bacterium]
MRSTLHTARFFLRPFTLADADDVTRIVSDRELAATTLNIPHPYEPGMAAAWIATHADGLHRQSPVVFAVTTREDAELVAAIGLSLEPEHHRAELGYWVARAAWGQGVCTEAARAVLQYGFGVLGLERIFAHHFAGNPASGRVMQKLGMRHEGTMRGHIVKWGRREDVECYGILREEFPE